MKSKTVTFPCGDLRLEGIMALPEGAGPFSTVILCHPHPLYGGSMDNNVICALSDALVQASLASFRFNFRGVGASQGKFGQGLDEQKDVEAAISFVTTIDEIDSDRLGLAGYSAGAAFALPIGCKDVRIKALVAVSPPLSMFDFRLLASCSKPKLLISGSKDNFLSTNDFLVFCHSLPEPRCCDIVEGADHFWWGYESRLATRVSSFFATVL